MRVDLPFLSRSHLSVCESCLVLMEYAPGCALLDGEVVNQVGCHDYTAALVADVSGMAP